MYITLESDYAIRIVHHLAEIGEKTDAKTISEASDVPLRFSLKILRKLVQNDLVQSFKGSKGGYQLAKPPENITLADVIGAVEGVYTFSRCLDPNFKECNCDTFDCKFQAVFDDITETVRAKLTAVNFATLINK